MKIEIGTGSLPETGVLVVLVGPDGSLSSAASEMDGKSGGLVRRALTAAGDTLKNGTAVDLLLPQGLGLDHLLLLVSGKDGGLNELELVELGGTLAGKLKGMRAGQVVVAPPDGLDLGHAPVQVMLGLALGLQLKSYQFTRYQPAKPENDEKPLTDVTLFVTANQAAEARAGLAMVTSQAMAVAKARDLVSEPANALYPETFAAACKDLEALGVAVEILGSPQIEELGMRALLGVAQGSVREPYVVVMRWQGGGDEAPLALIGKGVCFDTGGISIKPAAGMEGMKWDMGGAGAVYGAMMAIAGRKAKANVVGVLGLVENMPSGSAQRPGDVVRAMSGKTIEVINTDAEGRLVLADICWYAQDRFKPKAMVDLATLTGAIVVALGHEQAGLFANDETLASQLASAATATGELLWRMPLGKNYTKHIKSDIAEIKNVGRAREAGASAGAVFIQEFVNGVPWAHLDIAGVAWTGRDLPLVPKGATAFGVRLLDRLVADSFETR